MAVRILPAKMKRILPEKEYNKIYDNLNNPTIRNQKDPINFLVIYYFNNVRHDGACFSSIYRNNLIWSKGTILKINLFVNDETKLKTRYGNILKYFRHLSKLYSGLTFKIEVDDGGKLWAIVKNNKDYPNVVIRDIATRVRFLFEGTVNAHMDELLSNKNFQLSDIEEAVGEKNAYYVQLGHWLFNTNSPKNIIDYTNYEERFLQAHDAYKKEMGNYPHLNTITAKLLKNNE